MNDLLGIGDLVSALIQCPEDSIGLENSWSIKGIVEARNSVAVRIRETEGEGSVVIPWTSIIFLSIVKEATE